MRYEGQFRNTALYVSYTECQSWGSGSVGGSDGLSSGALVLAMRGPGGQKGTGDGLLSLEGSQD